MSPSIVQILTDKIIKHPEETIFFDTLERIINNRNYVNYLNQYIHVYIIYPLYKNSVSNIGIIGVGPTIYLDVLVHTNNLRL